MSNQELACTYAALILHDDGIAITADKIDALCKAAGVTLETYWPGLFAKLLEKKDIEELITNVGAGGGAPAAGGAAGGAAAGGDAEEKKEESEEEESDDDMGFSLFD
ncbi:acidic ribosomal protein P1 [Chloropicon primus]|uniref:Acidic ribosomal protein P1 n=1 Tax=Chloropicon primus TaxID=1764295 RepID=A0A5B8MRJ1_9CHLO|nr:acidic ribosomal protein P1 [Chloropicon primus]UPR02423.1 acidic ribosomal protein P1 [Chloropicon primus]|eukprot:QDZ23209.1 acidic ribosomal protein P1 [Chloropicon primus]